MANLEVTVAVETAIHGGLRKAIQAVADEHGIFIDKIEVEWIETTGQEKRHAHIGYFSEVSHS